MAVPCPECGYDMSQVIDSRTNGEVTRRRRECMECGHRYTTFEGVKIRSRKQIYQEVKDNLRENLIIALNDAIRKTFTKEDD